MLLPVNKLTKCGGGSLTVVKLADRTIYYWQLDSNFNIQLECTNRYTRLMPFVSKINSMDVLSNENGNLPALCFNRLINKWFCVECKSDICTESDDYELSRLSKSYSSFDENEGFYSNPIDAIANWNINTAMDLLTNANRLAYLE